MRPTSNKFDVLKNTLFGSEGELTSTFRDDIHTFITDHEDVDMENEVKTWVTKVDQASYKTLDREVTALLEQGYSESEIFEITVLSAFSAAETRLTKALSLLNQEEALCA